MNRNKLLAAVAVVAIVLAGVAWYFASPAYAMSQLKSAAESGDAAALEDRIDFPKVRESLKTQLRAAMATELARPEMKDNPFGALGAMLAMGMVYGMVEGFVTPEGMSAMIAEGRMQRPGQSPAPAPADGAADRQPVDWTVDRDGFDRFTATPVTPDGGPAPSLVFERDGLGWKLSGLELPAEGLGQ
ncbi:DUF2939 domain-containing protein [Altererythrobacter aerius]|uniref:DUF2939 domain-containing protein n=1 Tax=Tsuneonella aeria TaxID=1837929 RepID=A0A6I4TAM9_9SPHN|nr:DUF2939 domain-containing protein [Tsuneonella aeria]MXO73727.1 DUF2939 domain-containing protein [Tsuneonella aeria]